MRVNALDRPWAGALTASLVGPVRLPPRDAVVRAIVELATAFPYSRLGWQLDRDATAWSSRPDALRTLADEMVVSTDDDPAADYSRFLTAFGRRRDLPWPAAFLLAHDHLGLSLSHGVGDGHAITLFMSGVLSTAHTGQLPDWPRGPGLAHPYRAATASFFGRSPRRLARALRAARPARKAIPAKASIPWTPDPVTVYRHVRKELLTGVKAWRRSYAPGISMPALELTLLLKAFRATDLHLHSEVLALFDARRYVPRAQVDGNFVVGLLLPLSARNTVAEIANAMTSAIDSGRPLTALGLGLLTRRHASPPPATRPAGSLPRLAFTHIGRPQAIQRLPFLEGAVPMYAGSIDPADPCGITVATTQVGHGLHLSATAHAGVVDPAQVARALEIIAGDPVALLDDERRSKGFSTSSLSHRSFL